MRVEIVPFRSQYFRRNLLAFADRAVTAITPAPEAVRRARLAACGAKLSPREIEICELRVAGRSNAEIAVRLGVKPSTVDEYVRRARSKLGLARGERLDLALLAR